MFLFSAENVRCLKTQISTKIQKAKYPTKKKQETKKTHSLKARRGHAKHVCKIAGSNSQKRRGPWHLKQFWVLFLNQPVVGYNIVSQFMQQRTYNVAPEKHR